MASKKICFSRTKIDQSNAVTVCVEPRFIGVDEDRLEFKQVVANFDFLLRNPKNTVTPTPTYDVLEEDFFVGHNCMLFTPIFNSKWKYKGDRPMIRDWAFFGVSTSAVLSRERPLCTMHPLGMVDINCALAEYDAVQTPCLVVWKPDECISEWGGAPTREYALPILFMATVDDILQNTHIVGTMLVKPAYNERGLNQRGSSPTTTLAKIILRS
jgi:hypothetical protein